MAEPQTRTTKPRELLDLRRLSGLTDSIFGIAMTILVMNLAVPTLKAGSSLLAPLAGIEEMLLDFVISFGLLGIVWILNHRLLQAMVNTDRIHVWLTFGWMMCACLVPFTTELMGKNPGIISAAFWYNADQFAVGACLLAQCLYVSISKHLLRPGVSPEDIRRLQLMCASPCVAAGLAMVISLWSTVWCDLPYLLVPIAVSVLLRPSAPRGTGG